MLEDVKSTRIQECKRAPEDTQGVSSEQPFKRLHGHNCLWYSLATAKGARACILTLRNSLEWPALNERVDLSHNELTESTFGDIFPRRVFVAVKQLSSTPRLRSIPKR